MFLKVFFHQNFCAGKIYFQFFFLQNWQKQEWTGAWPRSPPAPWCATINPLDSPTEWSWLREFAQGNGFNGCQLTEKGSLSSASFLPCLAGVCLSVCAHPRARLTWQTSERGLVGYIWCQISEHTVFDAALVGNTRDPGKRRGVGFLPLKIQVLVWLADPSEKGFHVHCTDINASLQNEC